MKSYSKSFISFISSIHYLFILETVYIIVIIIINAQALQTRLSALFLSITRIKYKHWFWCNFDFD